MRRPVDAPLKIIDGCRSCGDHHLTKILDLGTTPLADRLLTEETIDNPEPIFV